MREIISYTGTGTSQMLEHNLGVRPDVVIVRDKMIKKIVRSDRIKDFNVEYLNWARDGVYFGQWNYYVHFNAKNTPTELWEKLRVLTPGKYAWEEDYLDTFLAQLDWHGGLTFAEYVRDGTLEIVGVKAGCDYQHSQDEGQVYNLDDIISDATATVESAIALFQESKMRKITVRRDNAKDLSFTGELLARVESSPDIVMGSSYSGSAGRWQSLKLYRTKAGKFICQRINWTQWHCDKDAYEAVVCYDHNQVAEFFGGGRLARELYGDAGVIAQEEVD